MNARKLPCPALPVAAWPAPLQSAWTAAITDAGWSPTFHRRVARALGSWFGFTGTTAFGAATPDATACFRAMLGGVLTPLSALTTFELVVTGLRALASETDWTWLVEEARTLRKATVARPSRSRPVRQSVPSTALTVAVADWPENWRAAWMAARSSAVRGKYRVRARTPAAGWSAGYAARIERGVGRFLGFCRRQDRAVEATPDSVGAWLDDVAARGGSSVTIAMYAYELWRGLTIVAPAGDHRWLQDQAKQLEADAVPSRNTLARLVSSRDLFRLGLDLMNEAKRGPPRPLSATTFRNGLLIALLAKRPARRRNIGTARLGKEIVLEAGAARLFFDRTKNGRSWSVPVPGQLVPYVSQYVERYRPALLRGRESEAFWIDRYGKPLDLDEITRTVCRLTRERLGRSISPHLFRHCLATTMSEHSTGALRVAAALLAHTDAATTRRYYDQATSMAAASALDRVLAPYRLPPPARRRPRP